jgi:D-serine deaminase-like pyridoxal phosphate-dependent protein
MEARYTITNIGELLSPSLVVFKEIVQENLAEMIRGAGDVRRLRPHCKTHKMREVVQMQLAAGITQHKCATLAEAEMLATVGVKDILLAYNPVGPNINRVVRFLETFPDVKLIVTGDDAGAITELGRQTSAAGQNVEVLLDLNTGQNRTGIEAGPAAIELYRRISTTKGIAAGGFHLYDGQNHQRVADERRMAVMTCWEAAVRLRSAVSAYGLPVPRIVVGGTGSFPMYAAIDDPAIELSPGTVIFHDANYRDTYSDLNYTPAALLLTRVISRPTADRVTFDLGYKAVASDPPAGRRLVFPDLPDAQMVLHNEEHLVVQTSRAAEFRPGDALLAIPSHVCPTSALHRAAYVVWNGRMQEQWEVVGRDRMLTI